MEIITFFEKLDKDILILTQEVKLFQIKLDFIIDASAPQMPYSKLKLCLNLSHIAFVTSKATLIISGPIPSPGKTAIFSFIIIKIF